MWYIVLFQRGRREISLLIHSLTPSSFTHSSLTHSLIHSVTHSYTHSFILSLTHSFTNHICVFPHVQSPLVYKSSKSWGKQDTQTMGLRRVSLERALGGTQSDCCGGPGGRWALPRGPFRKASWGGETTTSTGYCSGPSHSTHSLSPDVSTLPHIPDEEFSQGPPKISNQTGAGAKLV